MSEYGKLTEVKVEQNGSVLTSAAAVSATSLVVEYGGDFNAISPGVPGSGGGVLDLNGARLVYTDVVEGALPEDPDTILLAVPLAVAGAVGDLVLACDGGQVIDTAYAVCSMDQGPVTGDMVMVPLRSEQRPLWPVGLYDPPVNVTVSEDLQELYDAPGWTPTIDGGFIDPTTIPDPAPSVPPASSPALTLSGTSLGFIVTADNIAPTTLIRYYVSASSGFTPGPSTLLASSRSQVMEFRTLADGTPFAAGTTYYFRAIATNVAGDAPATAEVGGQLKLLDDDQVDSLTISKITSGNLSAAVALLGSLQVGQITITPGNGSTDPGGINIPLLNGGLISLPADGSAAQFLRVLLQATSLLVEDNLEVRGTLSKLVGTLTVQSAIAAPGVGPTVTAAWDDPTTYLNLATTDQPLGGIFDAGTTWLTVEDHAGNRVVSLNKTTGARTVLYTSPSFTMTSVTKVGTDYFVLGRKTVSGNQVNYVTRYDASWAIVTDWAIPVPSPNYLPRSIATNGTLLYVLYYEVTTGAVGVMSVTTAGASPTTIFTSAAGAAFYPLALAVTSADFATSNGSTSRFLVDGTVYDVLGIRKPTEDWSVPSGPIGTAWDGTNLRSIGFVPGAGYRAYKLSPVVTATARSVRWSKYDSDPAGTGGNHETAWSPATAFTQIARQWMKVVTPAPEDAGGSNDPDSIRHYIQSAGAGSYWRQATVTASPWAAYYGTPLGSGSSAVSSPDFSSIATPGVLSSAASDGGGNLFKLQGTGAWRMAPFSSGAASLIATIESGGEVKSPSGFLSLKGNESARIGPFDIDSGGNLATFRALGNLKSPAGNIEIKGDESWLLKPLFSNNAGTIATLNSTGELKTIPGGISFKGDDTWKLPGLTDAWTSYTPSWGGTVGNGTLLGAYLNYGKTVHFRIVLTCGSTTAFAAQQLFGLPFTPVNTADRLRFPADLFDTSASSSLAGTAVQASGTITLFSPGTTAGGFDRVTTGSIPFAWATGDKVTIWGTYERS